MNTFDLTADSVLVGVSWDTSALPETDGTPFSKLDVTAWIEEACGVIENLGHELGVDFDQVTSTSNPGAYQEARRAVKLYVRMQAAEGVAGAGEAAELRNRWERWEANARSKQNAYFAALQKRGGADRPDYER